MQLHKNQHQSAQSTEHRINFNGILFWIQYPIQKLLSGDLSHDYLSPEDSSIVRQRVESVTIEDNSFFKLEDYHYGDDFGTYVVVQGLDGAGNIII